MKGFDLFYFFKDVSLRDTHKPYFKKREGRTVDVSPSKAKSTAMDLEELEAVAGDLSQEEREAVARILREVADWLESTSSTDE